MRWGYKGGFNSNHNVQRYKDLKQIWYNVNTVKFGGVTETHIIFSVLFNFEIFHNKNANIHKRKGSITAANSRLNNWAH